MNDSKTICNSLGGSWDDEDKTCVFFNVDADAWSSNRKYVLEELQDIERKIALLESQFLAIHSNVHTIKAKLNVATWLVGTLATIVATELVTNFIKI